MKFIANRALRVSVLLLPAAFLLGCVSTAHAQSATALQSKHDELRARLTNNEFQRPIHLESSDDAGSLKSEVYAKIEQPYAVVGVALRGARHWCDMLILHQNIKGCRVSAGDGQLSLSIGRKFDQPLGDTYPIDFSYRLVAATADYLQVELRAKEGPLGTSDYRIMLESTGAGVSHSFLHLSYSYAYGTAARLGMRSYLATIGRNKVGFSVVGKKKDGQLIYLNGIRGVIERNTMRYYLAIEAYLGSLSAPPLQQVDKRLQDWYSGVERYPVQLHELKRDEYLIMKRKEIARLSDPSVPAKKP